MLNNKKLSDRLYGVAYPWAMAMALVWLSPFSILAQAPTSPSVTSPAGASAIKALAPAVAAPPSTSSQSLLDAERAQAQALRAELETARKETEAARKETQAAQVALTAARKEAEEARKALDAERLARETEKKEADAARKQADAALKDADAAHKEADAARKEAEAARSEAQAARLTSATATREALEAKTSATAARQESEKAKQEAQAARTQAETAHKESEAAKNDAAASRKQADAARQTAEETRKESDKAKLDAQAARKEAEAAKSEAQTSRKEMEAARQEAAASRQAAADAQVQLGTSFLDQKKFDEAQARFAKAAELAPAWSRPQLGLARVARARDQHPAADKSLLKALEIEVNAETRGLLLEHARAYLGAQRFKDALGLLRPAQARVNTDPEFLAEFINACNGTKQYDDGIAAGAAAVKAYLAADAADKRKAMQLPLFVPQLAVALRQKQALADAIKQVDEALAKKPAPEADKEILLPYCETIAAALMEAKKPAEAQPYYERAIKIAPGNAELRRAAARVIRRIHRDKLDEAIEYLKKALEAIPGDKGIRDDLGGYLFDAEKFADSEKIFRDLSDQNPQESSYKDRILQCMARRAHFVEGRRMILDIMKGIQESKLPPDQKANELENLASRHREIVLNTDLITSRIIETRERLLRDPDSAALHDRLGDDLLDTGQGELAVAEHLIAARLKNNGDVLVNHARNLTNSDLGEYALLYIKAVVDHFPAHSKTFETINLYQQIYRHYDDTAVFDTRRGIGYQLSEEACRTIAQNPAAPRKVRDSGEVERIRYHYINSPHSEEVGLQAKADYEALINRPNASENLRNEARSRIAQIESAWLSRFKK
ncbi:MAG: hypothetical protein NTX50_13645 [Candidatus Sumerlaeota bacterium]|nr:hypothetical protein [Candidatus Sumerlaeota bacterium]